MNVFPPHEKSPDFVKGKVSVHPQEFIAFLKEHAEYVNEKGYFSFNLLDGSKGLYLVLDTYKKS